MHKTTITVTTNIGTEGLYRVDLPMDVRNLNEHLFDIGLWLIERKIPHQARIILEPQYDRIRVSFHQPDVATAFRERFGARLH